MPTPTEKEEKKAINTSTYIDVQSWMHVIFMLKKFHIFIQLSLLKSLMNEKPLQDDDC